MKKFLGLFIALSILTSSFASGNASLLPSSKPAKINAANVFIPIGKDRKVSLLDLSHMRVKDFESITGRKLSFSEKVKFTLGQKQLAKSINNDGTINNKKLASLNPAQRATEKSHRYLRIWLVLLVISIAFSILSIVSSFFWVIGALAGLGAVVFFVLWLIELSKS